MNRKGFTLVELAIVLIVIGIILGMVFKGKQLIDNAKVKSVETQYNKILATINTFYDRYGYYPGDGCTTATPSALSDCSGSKDGILTTTEELGAFWVVMVDITGLLTPAEKKAVSGDDWEVKYSSAEGKDYILASLDLRYACDIDRKIDDGVYNTGNVRIKNSTTTYDTTTDCWSLSGVADTGFVIIP